MTGKALENDLSACVLDLCMNLLMYVGCVCVLVFVIHTLLPFVLLCRGHAGIGMMAAMLDGFGAQRGEKSQRGSDFSTNSQNKGFGKFECLCTTNLHLFTFSFVFSIFSLCCISL